MPQNNFYKFKNRQDGVSLIVTFFIMIIILAIVISVTTLLYHEIKVIRNIGNSVVAFYAADSGIEKVLYYDRKITNGEVRGLCSMFDYNATENASECPTTTDNSEVETAVNCNKIDGVDFLTINDGGNSNSCDADVCDNCTINFETSYGDDGDKSYSVTAKVSPDSNGDSALTIKSLGNYKDLTRKIELDMTALEAEDVIKIVDDYATPVSQESGEGYTISIKAEIEADKGVSQILAYIKTSSDEDWSDVPSDMILDSNNGDFELDGSLTDGIWTGEWPKSGYIADAGAYYVDIYVVDTAGNAITDENIQPWYLDIDED